MNKSLLMLLAAFLLSASLSGCAAMVYAAVEIDQHYGCE
jgi:hypothetical protein